MGFPIAASFKAAVLRLTFPWLYCRCGGHLTSGQAAAVKNGKMGKDLWGHFTHSVVSVEDLFC